MANYAARPSPQQIVSYLTGLGYNPVQAAAIAGNIEQESGFNPNALNKGEGAYGLLQWRGPRLTGLQQYAHVNGLDPADWRTQLNYVRNEMDNGEATNSTGFLNASSLPQANASLKNYIRYGDASEATRLSNAQNFLPIQTAMNAPPLTPGTQAPALPPPINVGSAPQSAGLLANATPAAATPASGLLGGMNQIASLGMGLMGGGSDSPPQPYIGLPVHPRVDMSPLVSFLQSRTSGPSPWSV